MALSTNFGFFVTVGMFAVANGLATSLLGISALRRLGTPATIAAASSQKDMGHYSQHLISAPVFASPFAAAVALEGT